LLSSLPNLNNLLFYSEYTGSAFMSAILIPFVSDFILILLFLTMGFDVEEMSFFCQNIRLYPTMVNYFIITSFILFVNMAEWFQKWKNIDMLISDIYKEKDDCSEIRFFLIHTCSVSNQIHISNTLKTLNTRFYIL
jgi:hypothetical protein